MPTASLYQRSPGCLAIIPHASAEPAMSLRFSAVSACPPASESGNQVGLPPCVQSTPARNKAGSFVMCFKPVRQRIKFGDGHERNWRDVAPRALAQWAGARLQTEISLGSAAVQETADAVHVISTELMDRKIDSHMATLKVKVGSIAVDIGIPLSSVVVLAWVRPLSRQLQRQFGWGDAFATPGDVQQAVEARDFIKLIEIHPRFSSVPDDVLTSIAPKAWELKLCDAALQDCQHSLQEVPRGAVDGGCSRCDAETVAMMCSECNLQLCQDCAVRAKGELRTDLAAARLHHDLEDKHDWQEGGKRDHCDACGRFACGACGKRDHCDACGKPDIKVCGCSAALCRACREHDHSPDVGLYRWFCSSPLRPEPFKVMDSRNVPNAIKLEYIQANIGLDADVSIAEFSEAALAIFPEARADTSKQKQLCLELFGKHTGKEYRKESDLPPKVLEEFQKVWDAAAPRRCRECSNALPASSPLMQVFCGEACAAAGKKITCRTCGPSGEVSIFPGCRVCKACGKGSKAAESMAAEERRTEKSKLDTMLKENSEMQRKVSDRWNFIAAADPDHQPAWTKRRRMA